MYTIRNGKDTKITLHHGTTLTRAMAILEKGFLARETMLKEIFFARDVETAIDYAKNRARNERDEAVVIICSIDLGEYHKCRKSENIYSFPYRKMGSEIIDRIVKITGKKEMQEIYRNNMDAKAKRKGGGNMDQRRLVKDLRILRDLKLQRVIGDYDYNVDGKDNWIIIYGIPLPKDKFNYPDFNMKLPIPENLYEADGDGRFQFYSTIFIDAALRRKSQHGYEHIARQIPRDDGEQKKGWSFLCVIPHSIGPEGDIRSVLPIIQSWIITDRDRR